ncbi:hypothetical protein EJ02DRAFT_129225 [Clathrospora elynae]|uniref:Uncharacterized protein n=1 Tax=Clathrospora elynae TaxID=706981 RepID=A0A6A5SUD7_9PLEO|nr:hypothetical protein EJ02DRAFT_129225 [Clathrospora elynae]
MRMTEDWTGAPIRGMLKDISHHALLKHTLDDHCMKIDDVQDIDEIQRRLQLCAHNGDDLHWHSSALARSRCVHATQRRPLYHCELIDHMNKLKKQKLSTPTCLESMQPYSSSYKYLEVALD